MLFKPRIEIIPSKTRIAATMKILVWIINWSNSYPVDEQKQVDLIFVMLVDCNGKTSGKFN